MGPSSYDDEKMWTVRLSERRLTVSLMCLHSTAVLAPGNVQYVDVRY